MNECDTGRDLIHHLWKPGSQDAVNMNICAERERLHLAPRGWRNEPWLVSKSLTMNLQGKIDAIATPSAIVMRLS